MEPADSLKFFDKHRDACDYAKANPSFIVIRHAGQWLAGARKVTLATIERTQHPEMYYDPEEDYVSRDEIFLNELLEREYEEYWNEYYENADPDDWNRSTEEGWYYSDE